MAAPMLWWFQDCILYSNNKRETEFHKHSDAGIAYAQQRKSAQMELEKKFFPDLEIDDDFSDPPTVVSTFLAQHIKENIEYFTHSQGRRSLVLFLEEKFAETKGIQNSRAYLDDLILCLLEDDFILDINDDLSTELKIYLEKTVSLWETGQKRICR